MEHCNHLPAVILITDSQRKKIFFQHMHCRQLSFVLLGNVIVCTPPPTRDDASLSEDMYVHRQIFSETLV
jgi:hypothetical protein